ncbi:MAG: hypothetical protein EOO75_00900 [Myxococcales bacterium]|nr:MAG: hypothetical protein EOO75_00900 [Myxococcales bacterium]
MPRPWPAAGTAGAGSGAGGEGGAVATACEPEPGGVCVEQVSGTVVDAAGQGLGKRVVTVCGLSCFGSLTDAQGGFAVTPGSTLLPEAYALSVHGGPDHASLYLRLPALAPRMQWPRAIVLPGLPGSGPELPPDGGPAAVVTSGPLGLRLAAGTSVELSLEDAVDGARGRMVRVARVEGAQVPFVEGAALGLALAPFGARLSPPAGLRVEVGEALAEGTPVEFVIMDDDLLADAGNLAGLPRVVATGQVEQGVAVSTAGPGLDRLTWLAVRAR